jgi:hypothetical protein
VVSEVIAFGRTADRYRLPAKAKEERKKRKLPAAGIWLMAAGYWLKRAAL